MTGFKVTKKFIKLTEDHFRENFFLYPDENCFLPAGTEGIIIDEQTIGLIPNLSEEEYSSILNREIMSKNWGAFLVLINGKLVTISSMKLEIVRYDPPGPIFEDEEDRNQYLDDQLNEIKKQDLETKENGST